jgi:predicted nucleotidyltransferase
MDLARPYAAVTPAIEGEVLTTLARTTRPLTGREVARLARRGTQPSVQRALNHLVDQGLVVGQEAGGRAVLYTLNREHLAYPAVEVLAGLRSELSRRLHQTVESWRIQPIHASVFGSAARGDGDTQSDIDVFLIRPAEVLEEDASWRDQVDELTASIRRWTGNHASISEVAEPDVARLRRQRPEIVSELEREAIVVAGPTTTELFRS